MSVAIPRKPSSELPPHSPLRDVSHAINGDRGLCNIGGDRGVFLGHRGEEGWAPNLPNRKNGGHFVEASTHQPQNEKNLWVEKMTFRNPGLATRPFPGRVKKLLTAKNWTSSFSSI